MKIFNLYIGVIALALLLPISAHSQDNFRPYSEDLLSRSTLTGDWGGLRNELSSKGVTLDFSVTQIEQGVVDGGTDEEWEYGGRGLFTLKIDTQKLGLWPGGFFILEAEGNWGDSINLNSGALMPVNSSHIYPLPLDEEFAVPNVSYTQFLSEYFGVFLGKLDTTTGDMNEFGHGKGDAQFFNLAFNINPVLLVAVPYSTLGVGAIILPVKGNPDAAIISFSVLAADGEPNTSGFDDIGNGDYVYAAEGRVRTDFFGKTGHQLLGAAYSTKTFSSLDQDLRFNLENQTIEKQDDAWAIYYNFDQYFFEAQKGSGKGIGVFGRLGVSDGNPNPIEYFYSIGIGGKGFLSQRPNDSFGIGYYYLDINKPKFTGPNQTRTFLRDEQGIEVYYNIGITPWMELTPDIQITKGAREYERGNGLLAREKIDTATALGLRLRIIF
ncbi:MAG: carbohydrate porin [Desulfobacterales bacterium]